MNRRLSVVLALVVIAPVVLMIWLGLRSVRLEQEQVERRLETAAARLLSQHDADLLQVAEAIEQEILALLSEPVDTPDAQRALVWGNRFIRQPFYLDADGTLLVPDASREPLVERERYFLERTAAWRRAGDVFVSEDPGHEGAEAVHRGWYTWFWEDGVQFVIWKRLEDGAVRGVELDPYALLAEMIAVLPHNRLAHERHHDADEQDNEYFALRDPRGDLLYAWGSFVPENGASPWAVRSLSGPLGAWQLSYYGGAFAPPGLTPSAVGLFLVIAGVVLVMITALVVLLREQGRAIREARQKVSFVNQVSHELKTPLTNICMYTELIAERLGEQETKTRQYTGIVLSESRRLGRMIHNVLSFGQQGRGTLRLQKTLGIVDEAIEQILAHFQPVMEQKQIHLHFVGGCPEPVRFDRDALEQIVGNLLTNVEKYAGEGTVVRVCTQHESDRVIVDISDDGVGIPAQYRNDIFKPFFRLDERLTQKASGAGIGLSISRELARLHGGDLVLLPTEKGACFRLTLAV